MKITEGKGRCTGYERDFPSHLSLASATIDFSFLDEKTKTPVDLRVTGFACAEWLRGRVGPGLEFFPDVELMISLDVARDFSALVAERNRLLKRLNEISAQIGA